MGRPNKYSLRLTSKICSRLADGESLRTICKDKTMPDQRTIFRWLADDDKHEFRQQYAHAREIQADNMFEEMLEIADDGTNDYVVTADGKQTNKLDNEHVQRSRLRVDARKWILSKMMPKKYGDKLEVKSTEDQGTAVFTLLPVPYGSQEDYLSETEALPATTEGDIS